MPAFFALYFCAPARYRNPLLLIGSLAFYLIGGAEAALVLLLSIALNHVAARAMRRWPQRSGAILFLAIAANLAPLAYYKYYGFITVVANDLLGLFSIAPAFGAVTVILPPGISFFTFQAISYLVDAHARRIGRLPGLVDFGMYHTSFPQLVAGPIVRYVEIEDRVRDRPLDVAQVHAGAVLFCIGLAKKVLLADNMGLIADQIFALPKDDLTTSLAWLATIAYTLQIFFDFSGYTDMAIGMGAMLGFRFPENFDQPYRSTSITEFWRRWHMTLSRWFRDYLYIPLGGNRHGAARTLANLLIVFFLCGLWHGAAYTFIVWGLIHGALLVIERVLARFGLRPGGPAGWLYAMTAVMTAWVFFRAPTVADALSHLSAMFGGGSAQSRYPLIFFLTPDKVFYMAAAIAIALLPRGIRLSIPRLDASWRLTAFASVVLILSVAQIAASGFNPFIYFRF